MLQNQLQDTCAGDLVVMIHKVISFYCDEAHMSDQGVIYISYTHISSLGDVNKHALV